MEEINLLSNLENKIVSQFGDVQMSNRDGLELVMEASELFMLHCCSYGGVCEGGKQQLRNTIMKHILKYKERFKKIRDAQAKEVERVVCDGSKQETQIRESEKDQIT